MIKQKQNKPKNHGRCEKAGYIGRGHRYAKRAPKCSQSCGLHGWGLFNDLPVAFLLAINTADTTFLQRKITNPDFR